MPLARNNQAKTPLTVVVIGLLGLASAMGIGRFAFTPALPLMQQVGDLNLSQGGWLASINYLGYLLGALACIGLRSQPAKWARYGLLAVALVTLAMALPGQAFWIWMLWRLLAGIASAFVLVGLSAWCLSQLQTMSAAYLSGWVFAGVGIGIMLAGVIGLEVGVWQLGPKFMWLGLGVVALLVWLVCRVCLQPLTNANDPTNEQSSGFTASHWWLIASYGIFGVGYILPATFLPAMAREQLVNPAVFGWVWPVFGLAAALSTLLVSFFFNHIAPKKVWAVATLVMAIGVIAPILSEGIVVLLLSALCVGGTFMVMTQTGMQEAKNRGGATLIAAMTASFAGGQVIGPLLLGWFAESLLWPSVLAAGLLLISFVVLIKLPAVNVDTVA